MRNIKRQIVLTVLIYSQLILFCGSDSPMEMRSAIGLDGMDAYHGFGISDWRGFGKGYWFWCGVIPAASGNVNSISMNYVDGQSYQLNDSGLLADDTANDGYWTYMKGLVSPPLQGDVVFTLKNKNGVTKQVTWSVGHTPSSVPVLKFPTNEVRISDLAPVFEWEPFPGADYYGICIYNSSDFSSETKIWSSWFLPGTSTGIKYNNDGNAAETELNHNGTYYIELFAHLPNNSMAVRSIRFYVY